MFCILLFFLSWFSLAHFQVQVQLYCSSPEVQRNLYSKVLVPKTLHLKSQTLFSSFLLFSGGDVSLNLVILVNFGFWDNWRIKFPLLVRKIIKLLQLNKSDQNFKMSQTAGVSKYGIRITLGPKLSKTWQPFLDQIHIKVCSPVLTLSRTDPTNDFLRKPKCFGPKCPELSNFSLLD